MTKGNSKHRSSQHARADIRRALVPPHESPSDLGQPPGEVADPLPHHAAPLVFYATIFLSAFLLFQVQPLVGKAILPWFGGSPALWNTSMLFFQITLLAGYALAHGAHRKLTPRWQLAAYATLSAVAIACLPILPSDTWKPLGSEAPIGKVLGVLSATVGLPFLLLSTNTTLLQVWYHRATNRPPYGLYALSNTGSLLGLLSYPFLLEPRLGLHAHALAWSAAFVVVAFLMTWCGVVSLRSEIAQDPSHRAERQEDRGDRPVRRDYAVWLSLSTCASVLLLAMTSHLSQNVAVVPFMWVMPLSVYLVSFIVAFADRRIYHRGVFAVLLVVSLQVCAWTYHLGDRYNVVVMLTIHLVALLAGCTICHGELARRKPAARYMTNFYLAMSIGGAIGGLLVNLVAPVIFFHYFEYPLVLLSCWVVLLVVAFCDAGSWLRRGKPLWAWCGLVGCLLLFLIPIRDGLIRVTANNLLTLRDFYGVLTVKLGQSQEGDRWVQLSHGSIVHGAQYLDDDRKSEPTTYYREASGVGVAFQFLQSRPGSHVGVLGMGVGTIATYARQGDTFRFYEIDSNIVEIATSELFSFWPLLERRGATGEIVLGDARISLERELVQESQQFDLLVLDVFTGDAVPVHLLTTEAFRVYFRHLRSDGVIAINISNRYLDLLPVVLAQAVHFDREIAIVIDPDRSEWLLLADGTTFPRLRAGRENRVLPVRKTDPQLLWTDDYSDIFTLLK